MSAVWVQTERAKCVHPGWSLLEGWETIARSWAAIFANTSYMRFVITDVSVHFYGHVAWVTCVENLSDAPGSTRVSRILATNVYEELDDDWRIVASSRLAGVASAAVVSRVGRRLLELGRLS